MDYDEFQQGRNRKHDAFQDACDLADENEVLVPVHTRLVSDVGVSVARVRLASGKEIVRDDSR